MIVSPVAFGESLGDWYVTPLNGGVARTESGLHVGFKSYIPTDTSYVYRPWLFVATFEPTTGDLQKLRRYDPLPAGVVDDNGNIKAFAVSNGEVFATNLISWDEDDVPRNQTLFIGHLDDDTVQWEVDLGWSSAQYEVTDIGWDGEAFAVHSCLNSTGDVFVARVSPEGEVLLPLTKYGDAYSGGGRPLGYRMSTNAESGMSYVFDTPGFGRGLGGHDRSGRSVVWAPDVSMDLVIPELNISADRDATDQGLSAEPGGGVWTAWSQGDVNGNDQQVVAHVTVDGEIDQAVVYATYDSSIEGVWRPAGVTSRSSRDVWVADVLSREIRSYSIVDAVVSPPHALVQDIFYDGERATLLDVSDTKAFDWQDERWLWFSESRPNVFPVIHVVKVIGDCQYLPATRPAQ